VDDTWTQTVVYDYVSFDKMTVWRLEGGAVTQMGELTGTETHLAAPIQGLPNIFSNIAATETSANGRFRYSLEPTQHDAVTWNMGARSHHCDKQEQSWGDGIKYTNSGYGTTVDYHKQTASAKDKATAEYAKFDAYRKTPVELTVISDFLILQTSSGDQSVFYYDKKTAAKPSQESFGATASECGLELTLAEVWDENPNSAATWSADAIHIGSYDGRYAQRSTNYSGRNASGLALNRTVTTALDNDPARTILRPARPTRDYYLGKYNIDVPDELPNGEYITGRATAFWSVITNHNPNDSPQPYSTASVAPFGAGYTENAPYSPNHTKVNDVVIHNPISNEYARILPLDDSRDQRSDASKAASAEQRAQDIDAPETCPGTVAGCEYRVLDCNYGGTTYHTADCYSATTSTAPNAHVHTTACISAEKIKQAFETSRWENAEAAPTAYTGTLPSSGWIGHSNSKTWTVNLP
jgi:hypothetical protein